MWNPNSIWLIHGCFYQRHSDLQIGFFEDEGPGAVVREGIYPFWYSGAFFRERNGGGLTGEMSDSLGSALLTGIRMTDDSLKFLKQYQPRAQYQGADIVFPQPPILYTFKKDGETGTWSGRWEHTDPPKTGVPNGGPTRCVIVETERGPFQSDIAVYAKELGLKGA